MMPIVEYKNPSSKSDQTVGTQQIPKVLNRHSVVTRTHLPLKGGSVRMSFFFTR